MIFGGVGDRHGPRKRREWLNVDGGDLDVFAYSNTLLTRLSKHRADIEQTSSWLV